MTDGQKKILIVDDDPDIVAALQLVLDKGGYAVTTASDSVEALRALESLVPDMIILDVMMKAVDEGFQLSYRIRQDERLSQVPILMLTSVSKETGFQFDPATDGEWLPVTQFVEKPIDPDDLLSRVESLTA